MIFINLINMMRVRDGKVIVKLVGCQYR